MGTVYIWGAHRALGAGTRAHILSTPKLFCKHETRFSLQRMYSCGTRPQAKTHLVTAKPIGMTNKQSIFGLHNASL